MKNYFKFYFVIILSILISSCTEVIKVDLDKENDRLIVDGMVTNKLEPFRVKIGTTLALDDKSAYPVVNNAFVTISDNAGTLDTLILEGNGVYKTKVARQGVVGRTYFITINVDGKTYTGNDVMTSISPIDSLYVIYRLKGDLLGVREDGYYAYFNSTDPPSEKNYYLLEATKNGKSTVKTNEIDVSDDKFFAPVVQLISIPGVFKTGDTLRFRFSSLSEAGFNYLNGVQLQLQNDGGFFSTPPANAPTNMSKGALGFFRATSIAEDSLIVP
jgi:hypothetical protein